MNHENYSNYRPSQPLGRSGGLTVETHIAAENAVPRTVVDSPFKQVQSGLPEKMTVVRPKKIVNPYFIIEGDPDLSSDDVAALESDHPEGKFIATAAMDLDASDFTSQEINHLVDIMDNGVQSGWTNLDVWEESR